MERLMYGYVLRGEETGFVKVGITSNFKSRISTYRTHTSEPLVLEVIKGFFSESEAYRWEQRVLSMHRARVLHGEWMDLELQDIQEISELGYQADVYHVGTAWIALLQFANPHGGCIVRALYCANREMARALVELWNSTAPGLRHSLFEGAPVEVTEDWLDENCPLEEMGF